MLSNAGNKSVISYHFTRWWSHCQTNPYTFQSILNFYTSLSFPFLTLNQGMLTQLLV